MPDTSLPVERVQNFHSVSQAQCHPTAKCLKRSLQTETRLTLDTVLKAHRGAMSLKISEREQDMFMFEETFTTLH